MDETLSVFGIPIPPSKVAQMAIAIEDKNSRAYEELTWNRLRTVIDDIVQKVDYSNLKCAVAELLAENIIRGKGMLYESCMKYQLVSQDKTEVFAALISFLNNRFPVIGSFFMQMIFKQFIKVYQNYDEESLRAVMKFVAHLTNFRVIEILIAKDVLLYCLLKSTNEYVQLAAEMFKELHLPRRQFRGVDIRFRRVRKCFQRIFRKGQLDLNVIDMVEYILSNWDSKFEACLPGRPELDLVKMDWVKNERITHYLNRNYNFDLSIVQDVFRSDPLFPEREVAYEILKRKVLLEGYWRSRMQMGNKWELRKYIDASWTDNYPEVSGTKLLQNIGTGGEMELCLMILEECTTGGYDGASTYLSLAEYLCKRSKVFQLSLSKCFLVFWLMAPGILPGVVSHVAKFYAEALIKDLVSWHVLAYVQLTPQDMTANSKAFLRHLFMELELNLTERTLLERFLDPDLQDVFEAFFPKEDLSRTRSALNFFKSMKLRRFVKGIKNSWKLRGL